MADNITAPAAGTTFATDEIGGVHYPRSKMAWGADGTATDVSAANRLPVDVGGPLAVTGTFYPAPQPVSGTVSISGTVPVSGTFWQAVQPVSIADPLAVTGTFWQATQPISAASLPLPSGAATGAKQDTIIAALATLLTEAGFTARIPTLGPKAASGSVSMTPSTDQDPILDHANAARVTVTTSSATAITPPAGTKYLRVHATAECFVRTDGSAAADAAGSIRLVANMPEVIPVVAGTAVTAVTATGTAVLNSTPMKAR
jgi:hypothetical protein